MRRLALSCLSILAACSSSRVPHPANTDAGLDAGAEPELDAGLDAGTEPALDAGMDAGHPEHDAGFDAGFDDAGQPCVEAMPSTTLFSAGCLHPQPDTYCLSTIDTFF